MERLKIAVVMGGMSPEHDISLMSGMTVLKNLNKKKFLSKGVLIQRDGMWSVFDGPYSEKKLAQLSSGVRPEIALAELMSWGVQVAFLALHGPNGEDGSIQGFFQAAGVCHTGSSVEACAASMNKYTSKVLASWAGLNTPPSLLLSKKDWEKNNKDVSGPMREIGFPSYVKTLHSGSSIGVFHITDSIQLLPALENAFSMDSDVIIEKEIKGREITCGVICGTNQEYKVLPPVEIKPKTGRFFDFKSKYDADLVDEICPADIKPEEWETLNIAAISICKRIGARGVSRIDFILNEEGLWFLELNAIPGLTPESIVLKEARVAGISLEELMEMQIYSAMEESGFSGLLDGEL